jgi:hypothetical protein
MAGNKLIIITVGFVEPLYTRTYLVLQILYVLQVTTIIWTIQYMSMGRIERMVDQTPTKAHIQMSPYDFGL